jgi:hypothetical protein
MFQSASGPASIPPPAALVCAAEPGEVTLHPTHRNSLSARNRRALHRERGAGGRLASAGVRLSHRGARTPDHKSRCHGRAAVPPLKACAGRCVAARSVLRRHGLQRRPVGVERWQRPGYVLQCVWPRLRRSQPSCVHPSRGKSLSTPPTGILSSPAAEHRGGGGVGASSLSRRALVPPWGSNPRPQDRAAALPRACGRSAPDCVLGRWVAARSVRESHGLQRGRVGVERQQRLVHGRQCVRPRLHTVPRCPRLRSPAGGSHAPPAALGRCLGGGRGESIPCLRELCVVVVTTSPTAAIAPCGGG